MRLKSVNLTHFRGYRATTVIPIDEAMTGIVGRNDYGKSTILEALAIFFESGDVKADKSDMNCFSLAEGAEQFEITCEFDGLPEALVLDENARRPWRRSTCSTPRVRWRSSKPSRPAPASWSAPPSAVSTLRMKHWQGC